MAPPSQSSQRPHIISQYILLMKDDLICNTVTVAQNGLRQKARMNILSFPSSFFQEFCIYSYTLMAAA
jgi:hypothetical protein